MGDAEGKREWREGREKREGGEGWESGRGRGRKGGKKPGGHVTLSGFDFLPVSRLCGTCSKNALLIFFEDRQRTEKSCEKCSEAGRKQGKLSRNVIKNLLPYVVV